MLATEVELYVIIKSVNIDIYMLIEHCIIFYHRERHVHCSHRIQVSSRIQSLPSGTDWHSIRNMPGTGLYMMIMAGSAEHAWYGTVHDGNGRVCRTCLVRDCT